MLDISYCSKQSILLKILKNLERSFGLKSGSVSSPLDILHLRACNKRLLMN